ERPRRPDRVAALCPLRSDSDRFGCTAANAPLCQKGRYAVQQIASASVAILRLISSGHCRAGALGEVLNLLEIWRGASCADVNQQTGFGEPGKGARHGDKATCFASHA